MRKTLVKILKGTLDSSAISDESKNTGSSTYTITCSSKKEAQHVLSLVKKELSVSNYSFEDVEAGWVELWVTLES